MTVTEPLTDPATSGPFGAPYLAVDVQPDILAGAFTLGVSELGGTDVLGGISQEARWVNVVCDVTGVSLRRGATALAGVLTRAEAGSVVVTANDVAGELDPLRNNENIHRGTAFRLRAWGYVPGIIWELDRTNLVTNPRLTTAVTGWTANYGTGGAGALTRVATGGPDGGPFARATWTTASTAVGSGQLRFDGRAANLLPLPVTPGQVLSGSVAVRTSIAQRLGCQVTYFRADGTQTGITPTGAAGPQQVVPAGTWTVLSIAGTTVPANAAFALIGPQAINGTGAVVWPVGATLDATRALLETGSVAGAYFDGDTPDTPTELYAWAGTVSASTSMQSVAVDTVLEWTSVLFTGRISEVRAAYLPEQPATVTIDASDLIAALAGWEAEGHAGDGIGAGDTLITRVERVLDETDIGEISADSETAFYHVTLLPTVLDHAWDVIVAAADAELGAVWVNEDNQLVVHSRAYMFTSLFAGPVRGTLSDVHGDADTGPHVCMSEAVVVYDADVANRVMASRRALEGEDSSALVVTRMDDVYSQTRYGLNTLDRTNQLEVQNATQVANWVSDVMASGGVPWLRVDTVNPSPTEDMLEEALAQWQAVMSTQIGDRWQFRFHPADLVVDQTLDIQGIEMDLGPDAWSITWTTMRGGNRRQVRPRPAT